MGTIVDTSKLTGIQSKSSTFVNLIIKDVCRCDATEFQQHVI